MTRFKESAQRTVRCVTETDTGWEVTFIDGSYRFVTKEQKKGNLAIEPDMFLVSCRKHCTGPDQNGKCTWRPRGPRANNTPDVACKEQFVYVAKPQRFNNTPRAKFARSVQKLSYQISHFRKLRNKAEDNMLVTFKNGTKRAVLKSTILGRNPLIKDYYLVPCGEECRQRGGVCPYCYGDRRGTECKQQFYFCRKFLGRHTNDRQR